MDFKKWKHDMTMGGGGNWVNEIILIFIYKYRSL
jgi:hypothetical protein